MDHFFGRRFLSTMGLIFACLVLASCNGADTEVKIGQSKNTSGGKNKGENGNQPGKPGKDPYIEIELNDGFRDIKFAVQSLKVTLGDMSTWEVKYSTGRGVYSSKDTGPQNSHRFLPAETFTTVALPDQKKGEKKGKKKDSADIDYVELQGYCPDRECLKFLLLVSFYQDAVEVSDDSDFHMVESTADDSGAKNTYYEFTNLSAQIGIELTKSSKKNLFSKITKKTAPNQIVVRDSSDDGKGFFDSVYRMKSDDQSNTLCEHFDCTSKEK